MFSNVEKRPLTPSSADPSKKYLPTNCILKCGLDRLRNTKTGSDKWARRVLLEIHFCTLSRVYQEQRTEFGYILYVLKAVFLLVVSPGGLCAVLPGGRAVCPRWNPGTHWGGDVDCSGVVEQCLLGWIYVKGLRVILLCYPRPSWFYLVPLGKREQSWPRVVVALGDVLNRGNASYGSFLLVFCTVGWWCGTLFATTCIQRCSREQLFMFPSGN